MIQFPTALFYRSHCLYSIEHSFWSASFATIYHEILVPPFLSRDPVYLRDSLDGTVSECPRLSVARANDLFGSFTAPLRHFSSHSRTWLLVSRARSIASYAIPWAVPASSDHCRVIADPSDGGRRLRDICGDRFSAEAFAVISTTYTVVALVVLAKYESRQPSDDYLNPEMIERIGEVARTDDLATPSVRWRASHVTASCSDVSSYNRSLSTFQSTPVSFARTPVKEAEHARVKQDMLWPQCYINQQRQW